MIMIYLFGFVFVVFLFVFMMIYMFDGVISVGIMLIFFQGDDMLVYYVRLKVSDGVLFVVIVVQEIFGVYEYICDIC